jgi:hypothetical protein
MITINSGHFFLLKMNEILEVRMKLREGVVMVYSSPSISGVGKAGVLLRKRPLHGINTFLCLFV